MTEIGSREIMMEKVGSVAMGERKTTNASRV